MSEKSGQLVRIAFGKEVPHTCKIGTLEIGMKVRKTLHCALAIVHAYYTIPGVAQEFYSGCCHFLYAITRSHETKVDDFLIGLNE